MTIRTITISHIFWFMTTIAMARYIQQYVGTDVTPMSFDWAYLATIENHHIGSLLGWLLFWLVMLVACWVGEWVSDRIQSNYINH